jgi:hypothetical protein
MRRPITIAIAVTMMGLFALMFWQMGMNTTGTDAAVARTQSKAEYAIPPDPYLPIRRLEPSW